MRVSLRGRWTTWSGSPSLLFLLELLKVEVVPRVSIQTHLHSHSVWIVSSDKCHTFRLIEWDFLSRLSRRYVVTPFGSTGSKSSIHLVSVRNFFFSSLVAESGLSQKTVSFAILTVVKRFVFDSTSLFSFSAYILSFSLKNLLSDPSGRNWILYCIRLQKPSQPLRRDRSNH